MSKELPAGPTYDQHPADRDYGPTVLVIDDDPHARERLELALLSVPDFGKLHLLHAIDANAALEVLSSTQVHVVLLDKNLDGDSSEVDNNGIELIPEILRLQPHVQIVMVTGSHEFSDVVRAMNLGAFNYVTKETPDELLLPQIDRAIQLAFLKLDRVRRERNDPLLNNEMGGRSKVFQGILRQGEVLAESSRPILILGESGTGKTALAKWIHRRREHFLKQKDRPFFAVNVASLSRDLIESELFGHEKGSFTDARQTKQGLFELANNGTLFLDEIGELPLDLQPKLLTVIEGGNFMRVGGSKQLRASPKLIFATNRNLEKMVTDGAFREDLYMRISMFPIRMPSLSERREDIPDIIRSLLPHSCRENRLNVHFSDLPKDFIDHLIDSPSEGNIRGIQHQLDRLLVLAPRDKSGQPVLSRWRAIPGLSRRKGGSSSGFSDTFDPKAPLTYAEMMSRPWDLLNSSFPGLKSFLSEVKGRIISEAEAKNKNNRELAAILRTAESTSSILTNNHSKDRASKKGRSL